MPPVRILSRQIHRTGALSILVGLSLIVQSFNWTKARANPGSRAVVEIVTASISGMILLQVGIGLCIGRTMISNAPEDGLLDVQLPSDDIDSKRVIDEEKAIEIGQTEKASTADTNSSTLLTTTPLSSTEASPNDLPAIEHTPPRSFDNPSHAYLFLGAAGYMLAAAFYATSMLLRLWDKEGVSRVGTWECSIAMVAAGLHFLIALHAIYRSCKYLKMYDPVRLRRCFGKI